MALTVETDRAEQFADEKALARDVEAAASYCHEIRHDMTVDADSKGWVADHVDEDELARVLEIAAEIRDRADVFVLVGVGGSNQAARAVIEGLADSVSGPRVVYAGNTLSAVAVARLIRELEGKSFYINVIAKNFETLEPGSHYRVLRDLLRRTHADDEVARRTILTGSPGSHLHDIARREGCRFLEFPHAVGGRYSAFSAVGLLPIAVAGLDPHAYLRGRSSVAGLLSADGAANGAVRYAATRHALFAGGYTTEVLAGFEPDLHYFSRWWWQLFGESEGKKHTGIYPSMAVYSEDLHSIGQYLQDGQRSLMETFISVRSPSGSVTVPPDPAFGDRFDYLDGMDFVRINRAAEESTCEAHLAGGVPCLRLVVDELDEFHFGELYYFFMVACAVSGKLFGINPFDQDGVEHYKRSMFRALGKPDAPAGR